MSTNKIVILENNSEIGAGTRGSSLGIAALKIAALKLKKNYFIKYKSEKIIDNNNLLHDYDQNSLAINSKGVLDILNKVHNQVVSILDRNKFPLVLAGDHSSAAGTIAGIKSAYPNQRIGVIWIDAHADVHTPYTTPSGNIHGMPLAITMGIDNVEHRSNVVDHETAGIWSELKAIGGEEPKIEPRDLVYISVRDAEEAEEYFISENNVKHVYVEDVRKRGPKEISDEVLEYLKECDLIYMSFDVDSMDCDLVSYGTGTPVPNGLTENEAAGLVNHFLIDKRVCCFEMVEINPCLDNKQNAMAESAMRILENATNIIEKRG
ncbi:MAG: arginase [Crocinitomicaceae bacterium]|jgi:arginase|nr:arginase [Crocinitomicaceae bacterium]MBT6513194.1 arginase [Crocinitomicaceae bacterium]